MDRIKGYALAAISAISYGMIPYFVIPVKREGLSLNMTLFYRFAIAALCLALILLIKKISFKVSFRDFVVFIILGLFYGGGADLLFLGYDHLTPGIASTLFFVYPVFVVLVMRIFFNEKIKNLTIVALAVILAGVYALSAGDSEVTFKFLGLLIALCSALFYSLYIITINKAGLNGSGWWVTFYVLLTTSLYYVIKMIITQDEIFIPALSGWINLTAFSLITTVISVTALTYAIKLIGSTPTSIFGALEPVVAVAISVVLFGENLTSRLILGVLLIIAGVVINVLADHKKT